VLGSTTVAPHRLRWSRQLRRVTHSAVVLGGALCVALVVTMAVFAGSLAPRDPDDQNFDLIEARPSPQALFGTDRFGRDVLSRVIHGSRISLYVAITSISVAMVAGGTLGLTAGYLGGGWDNVMIANVADASDRAAEGARLGTYAKSLNMDPYAMAMALLQRSRGSVGMVGFAMSEDNLDRILAHPQGMVCSDGGAFATDGPSRRGHPHPRGLGTFPRVLGRYVRERKALTLTQAIHKMTAQPASRVHLADRGRLAPRTSKMSAKSASNPSRTMIRVAERR